jgi:opacity protein-like surface antigen
MRIARFGLAAAVAAACACVSMSAHADGMRGSVKDAPVMVSSPGRCYLRADVGYSWSQDPDVRWTITDPNPGPTQWEFVTDKVTNLRVDNSWFGEAGAGCGSGERGIRGEVMVGFHGKRKIDGEPGVWSPNAPPPVDPLHTSVSTTTIMFNAYYDLGQWAGRFVPYVGAGVGVARNVTDDVYFTGNPALVNRILGDERWSLAWSLMAGVGWQVTRPRHARLRLPLPRHGQGGVRQPRHRRLLEPQGARRRHHRARVQDRPALCAGRRCPLLRDDEVSRGA